MQKINLIKTKFAAEDDKNYMSNNMCAKESQIRTLKLSSY